MWRNKKAMHLWLKPKHLLIETCTTNLPLPSLCRVTNYPIYQTALPGPSFLTAPSLQPGAGKLSTHRNGSLIHTCVPNQSWWSLINCALPQCPNSGGLWGGAWHMVIDVPQHWELTKRTKFLPGNLPRLPNPRRKDQQWFMRWPPILCTLLASPYKKLLLRFRWMENSPITNVLHRSPRTAKKRVEILLVTGGI